MRPRHAAALLLSLVAAACTHAEDEGAGERPANRGPDENRLMHVEAERVVYGSTYVSPLVEVFGDVFVGQRSFVASNTVFRAAPGERITFGNESNAQDNIIIRALDARTGIHDETSLAHHAIVQDSQIGDFAFVGFRAEIRDARIGDGAVILHGARVEGVTIPDNRLVAPGQQVTRQADADRLPEVDQDLEEFKREVLDVNAEFAEGYIDLYESEGYGRMISAGPNPVTSWNRRQVEPEVPAGAELGDFARLVGDVRMGPGAQVEERAAIRADEGTPIVIGSNADIGARVTFHALKGSDITAGNNLSVGDHAVVHGPIRIGNDVRIADDAVVFRVIVGDRVRIGEGAIVSGPAGERLELRIPNGAIVPANAVITDVDDVRALRRR